MTGTHDMVIFFTPQQLALVLQNRQANIRSMIGSLLTHVLVICLIAILFISCSSGRSSKDNSSGPSNANSSRGNSIDLNENPNDDIEELKKFVRVPFDAEEVVWRFVQSLTQGRRLVAVFRLGSENIKTFAGRQSAESLGNPVLASVEQWYPAELIAMSETTSENAVAGVAYSASEFVQSPFNRGTVTIISDSGFVILEVEE